MLGTKHDQTGAVLVQGGTDSSADTPRTWPRANGQPQTAAAAIPTLTGAVLVVNARMGEQQRPAPLTGG